MIPQIDNSLDIQVLEFASYPNKTYKCNEYQIAGKVDDLDAVRQTIEHILSSERYAYLIYDDNYGVELEQYIGQSYEYLEATIEDTLREALTQDDRILDVSVTNITKSVQTVHVDEEIGVKKVEIAIVEFDVYCKQGVIHTEVDVNV